MGRIKCYPHYSSITSKYIRYNMGLFHLADMRIPWKTIVHEYLLPRAKVHRSQFVSQMDLALNSNVHF